MREDGNKHSPSLRPNRCKIKTLAWEEGGLRFLRVVFAVLHSVCNCASSKIIFACISLAVFRDKRPASIIC